MYQRFSIAAVLLCTAFTAGAQPATTDLGSVFVTATRTARSVDETLAPVTVITRSDIESSQAQSVQELLVGHPGLTVSNNGGAGKSTSLFVRGTESDHVLVLIDGIKVGSATLGTTAFQNLPVELIERIEIVRGPRSSLYGSEAIGGVIQIFTRRGDGTARPEFSVGAGSFGSATASAALSGGNDRYRYSVGASTQRTDGINACEGDFSAGCFTVEPDKDGYDQTAASLSGGYTFAGGTELSGRILRSAGDVEFDGGFQNEGETVQQVIGVTLRTQVNEAWQTSLNAGRSQDESDNFKDGVFASRFDTERDTLSWQNDLAIGSAALLTVGLDLQRDRVDSNTTFDETSRDNTGLFAEYQRELDWATLQLSLRADDNEQFGSHVTGGTTLGFPLGNGLRATASLGTAFKAPTFNELYFPGFGNPDLEPEESVSYEVGLASRRDSVEWSLNLFQTEIEELIGFDASFSPANIDKARIQGLEATYGFALNTLRFSSTLTVLNPENLSAGANRGNVLPRRAENSLQVNVAHEWGPGRVAVSVLSEGRRYDDQANTIPVDGYATVDLSGEYSLAAAWRLQARISNLFDEEYQTVHNFNQPGRGYFVTLRYRPE